MQHRSLNRLASSVRVRTQLGCVSIEVLMLGTAVAFVVLCLGFGIDANVLFDAIFG
jgi:hypothetical protein